MSISTIIQSTAVDGIASIVVTDTALDADSGKYVREVRVYGPNDNSGNPVLQFTLRLIGDTHDLINFTAPVQRF